MRTLTIKGYVEGVEKEVTFPIAPTPLAKLVESKEIFFTKKETEESINALAEALYHGIRRAKGEVTREWLRENIDIHNFADIFTTFVQINGLQPKGQASGEAQAGAAS